MNLKESRNADRRRVLLLAPLMVAASGFLFACVAALVLVALNGGDSLRIIPLAVDANQQVVRDYLAQSMPSERYRVCEWLPAAPAAEKKVAQRVKLAVYGPSGFRRLDTIFWVQNGTVRRVTEASRAGPSEKL